MPTKVLVLLSTQPILTLDVLQALLRIDGVLSFDSVTGPYDIIVAVEAEDLDGVMRIVEDKLQAIPGVTHTITCLSLASYSGPGQGKKSYDDVLREVNLWVETRRHRPALRYLLQKYGKRFGAEVVGRFAEEHFGPYRGSDPLRTVPHTVRRRGGACEIAVLGPVPIAEGGSARPLAARLAPDGRATIEGQDLSFNEQKLREEFPNLVRLLQHPKYHVEHGGE